jgi:O-antigen biosynthesis protein
MPRPVPILLYHSVDSKAAEAYRRWAVTPAAFERHMAIIRDEGMTPLTLSQFVGRTSAIHRPVLITFDDGLHDFITGALPILQKYKFPATLYVTTGHVGRTASWLACLDEGDRPMMNWQDIRHASSCGIEIGAHTQNHPNLDLLPYAKATAEIAGSKQAIEDNLDNSVTSFAYPHGYSTKPIRAFLKQTGFTSACSVKHALSSTIEDCFTLSRVIIENATTDAQFKSILNGQSLPIAPPNDTMKQFIWRQVRRFRTRHEAAYA